MNRQQAIGTPSGRAAYILGQASAMLGVVLSMMWGMAFVLILAHAQYLQAHGGGAPSWIDEAALPIEPALFGLALGGLGLFISRARNHTAPLPVVVGLVANCIPLALAWTLQLLRADL